MKRKDLGDLAGLSAEADAGGRRRWSLSAKRQIVLESQAGPGAIVATARRHGISRSPLMAWRRAFLVDAVLPSSGFVPVSAIPAEEPERVVELPATPASWRVEIVLLCGRRLVLDGAIDADMVLGLARGLEGLT